LFGGGCGDGGSCGLVVVVMVVVVVWWWWLWFGGCGLVVVVERCLSVESLGDFKKRWQCDIFSVI
jgi:hypothetical protein